MTNNWSWGFCTNSDRYHRHHNPFGNLLLNGALQGSGGAIHGRASGAAPDHVVVDATQAHGADVAIKISALADGRPCIAIAIDGAAAKFGYIDVRQPVAALSDIDAGDTLQAEAYVEISPHRGVAGPNVMFSTEEAGATYRQSGCAYDHALPFPAEGFCGLVRTPRRKTIERPTRLHFSLCRIGLLPGPVSAVVKIAGAALRKVV